MKHSVVSCNGASILMVLLAGIFLFEITSTYAAPHNPSYPGYYSPISMEGQNPEYLLQTIARLRQALIADDDLENSIPNVDKVKRINPDFGTQRGSSGNMEHKHRLNQYYGDMIGKKKRDGLEIV